MPSELLWKLGLLGDKGNLEKASSCICCLSGANSSHTHKNQYTEEAYFGVPCPAMPQWLCNPLSAASEWLYLYVP